MHPVAQPKPTGPLTQPNGPGTPPQPGPPQLPPPQFPPSPSPPPQSPPPQCPWPWPSCCHGICGALGKVGAAFATPDPSPRAANPSVLAIVTLAATAFRFIMRPLYATSRFRDIRSEPFQAARIWSIASTLRSNIILVVSVSSTNPPPRAGLQRFELRV